MMKDSQRKCVFCKRTSRYWTSPRSSILVCHDCIIKIESSSFSFNDFEGCFTPGFFNSTSRISCSSSSQKNYFKKLEICPSHNTQWYRKKQRLLEASLTVPQSHDSDQLLEHESKRRKPFEKCKETSKRKRVEKAVDSLWFETNEEKASARRKIYHALQDLPLSVSEPLPADIKRETVSTAVRESFLQCTPMHNLIRKHHYTQYSVNREITNQLDDFKKKLDIVGITSPCNAIMANISHALKIAGLDNPRRKRLVFQGDGRNLSFKGDVSRTDNTVFGFKIEAIEEMKKSFFLPIGMIWAPEKKDFTINIFKELNFEKELAALIDKGWFKEVVFSADMKFQWVMLGVNWESCIFCGANRKEMLAGDVGKGTKTRDLSIKYILALDVLHAYLRCFEGIIDLMHSGFFKKISSVKARREKICNLYGIRDEDINTKNEIKKAHFKSKERKHILQLLELNLQNERGDHINTLHSLIRSFNSLMKLVQSNNSETGRIRELMLNLKYWYFQAIEKIEPESHGGLCYFHELTEHSDSIYQKIGNFSNVSTDECETSHINDKKRYHSTTEHKFNQRVLLKLMYASYMNLGIF